MMNVSNPYDADAILADDILKRKEFLSAFRSSWENVWREISNFILPDSDDFEGITTAGSVRKYKIIHDSTAPRSAADLATTFHSQFTNLSQKWFVLRPPREILRGDDGAADKQVRKWFDDFTSIMFEDVFTNPDTNFGTCMHEFYLSLIAYGTAVMYVEDRYPKPILFRSLFLGECYIAEGDDGLVDTVYREFMMTGKNLLSAFGDAIPADRREVMRDKPFERYAVIHAVEPNIVLERSRNKKDKPFRSVYILVEGKIVLSRGGHDTFPYVVCRWDRRPNEIYGRSPSLKMLPDIKTLNAMVKITLEAAQMAVFPPMQRVSDGLFNKKKFNLAPKMFYHVRTDRNFFQPLVKGINPAITETWIEQYRVAIRDGYYGDITGESKKNYLTATEVYDTRDKSQSKLGSVMNRIETEALKPIVSLVMQIVLRRNVEFADSIPVNFNPDRLGIYYVSPISRSMRMTDLAGVARWLQLLGGDSNNGLPPDLALLIDWEAIGRYTHDALGLPESFLVGTKEYKETRERMQAQQEQALDAQTARAEGGAVKDFATASPVAQE